LIIGSVSLLFHLPEQPEQYLVTPAKYCSGRHRLLTLPLHDG